LQGFDDDDVPYGCFVDVAGLMDIKGDLEEGRRI
jgi:hypothetical protein